MKRIMIIFLICTFFVSLNSKDNKMDFKRLIQFPVKDEPTISFKIWFKVGSQNDPKGKEGLAYLTARLLSEGGTKKNTYEQILDKLFPLAASYEAEESVEMIIFSGRVHKDNLKEYYKLFIEQLINPAFREDDFNRIKQNALNYLNTTLKYSSDEELGKAVLYNSIFKETNYGHISVGTESSLNKITLNDIREFYKKYFNKNNFEVGMAGGYDEKLVNKLLNDLQKLPDGKKEQIEIPNPEKITGLNTIIVNKNASATAISFGFPINILRGEKDWYALAIANSWFGEHRNSSSHLYQVIREERGLNYGDYSYIENFPRGGQLQMPPVNVSRRKQIFEIWIRPIPNEAKHFALRSAIRELKFMVDNGLTKEQFDLTRKFLKNYVLHYAPTTELRLGYAIDDKFYKLKESHLEKFRKMMDELTLEDVNNAIKKYLQYDNMKIVFVTNESEKLKNDLINNVQSLINYTSPKPQSILDEDEIISNFKLRFNENNISVINVEDLFK